MGIKQLNASYVAEEDRVLFRFTTTESQEFRLWFTRASVRDLLAIGAQASVAVLAHAHPPEQAKLIAEFKQQAKQENAQFTTFEPAPVLPMGEEPQLVQRLRITVQNQAMALELTLSQGRIMTVQMDDEMMGQLRLLLHTVSAHAQWALQPAQSDPQDEPNLALASAQPAILH